MKKDKITDKKLKYEINTGKMQKNIENISRELIMCNETFLVITI